MAADLTRVVARTAPTDRSYEKYVICFNNYHPVTGWPGYTGTHTYLDGNHPLASLGGASIYFSREYALAAYKRFLKKNPDLDREIYRRNVSIVPVIITADFTHAEQIPDH